MSGENENPSGRSRPVKLDIYEGRGEEDSEWELPSWGHPLSQGIFPLLVTNGTSLDTRIYPVGTAFCISKLGLLASAMHNLMEALKCHRHGDFLRQQKQLPKDYKLDDMGLAVFHHCADGRNRLTGNIWPLEGTHGAPPTDVIYGFPKYQDQFQYLSLPLSFAVPRIGSKVTCIGYSDTKCPPEGILLADLIEGRVCMNEIYDHRLRLVEGRVTRIFTNGFARGFIDGPCFTIGVEVYHGMSGGPVLNEQGYVCGIVSAGATEFFNGPASIISLLYPTLLTKVKFGGTLGQIRINAVRPILDMIAQGSIHTDGSETLVHIVPEDAEFRIGPMIREEDSAFVHESFGDYQEGRVASREAREIYRIRPRKNKGN